MPFSCSNLRPNPLTPDRSQDAREPGPAMHRNNQRRAVRRRRRTGNPAPWQLPHSYTHTFHAPEPCNHRHARPDASRGQLPSRVRQPARQSSRTPQANPQTRPAWRKPGPRPPEASCAPRSAPEPDSPVKRPPSMPCAPSPAHWQQPDPRDTKPISIPRHESRHPISISGPDPRSTQPHRYPAWRRSGSNRRPPACKAGALPAELRPLGEPTTKPRRPDMGQGGLEPPTPRLSSVCSNQLSY